MTDMRTRQAAYALRKKDIGIFYIVGTLSFENIVHY